MPGYFLLRRHPLRYVAPRQRKQSPPDPRSKFEPEGGTLRHEQNPGPKAEEHDCDRNALLPTHAQATFLLGMAHTSTGMMRPMIVATGSGVAQAMLNPV